MLSDALSPQAVADFVEERGLGDHLSDALATDAPRSLLRLGILYATETGTSEDVAKALARESEARSLKPVVKDLADADLSVLADLDVALFVCSTTGEGDVPYAAQPFFDQISDQATPRIEQLRFAVLALGDSSYAHFCAAGIKLDAALGKLGGVRLLPRVDCDTDYDDTAAAWHDDVLTMLVPAAAANAGPTSRPTSLAADESRREKYGLVEVTVRESRILSKAGSTKATRHLALAFSNQRVAYEAGDALGVVVENDPATVRAVLDAGGFRGDEPVLIRSEPMPLEKALRIYLEITTVTPRFIAAWAELSRADDLFDFVPESASAARVTFMHAHHVVDVMRAWPVASFEANALVAMLRPLQPRLYSISSSPEANSREVHLAIAPVAYDLHGQQRSGVATGQLCGRIAVGASLQVYVQSNPHFRLPRPETPVIMIGAGTGVAPYRSFLQQREAQKAAGGAWLFFGERNCATDFLYEEDFKQFQATGVLTRINTAFSRDGAEKIYVQHRLVEQADELSRWIERGAHVYVCGDAARMAPDVHAALVEILVRGLCSDLDSGAAYLATMQREGRYQRDVY